MTGPTHGDRLSAVDASFLYLEDAGYAKHVGACVTFAGPAPSLADLTEHVASRLHLVPRFRHRVLRQTGPLSRWGRPIWVDDCTFSLAHHLRRVTLPAPGGETELTELVAHIWSTPLDRSRPLWEIVLVDGLSGGSFALVDRTHHALIDGSSGVDIMAVLFDIEPTTAATSPVAWQPRTMPGTVATVLRQSRELLAVPARLVHWLVAPMTRPRAVLAALGALLATLGPPALRGAPRSPLNSVVGAHRVVRWVPVPLAEVKAVKDALGGTVNDVVLAIVSGSLRRWLLAHGHRADVPLRAMVPVSLRTADDAGSFGNRLTAMRAALPVDVADPVARLEQVSSTMAVLKRSPQLLGAEVVAMLLRYIPAPLAAVLSRLNFHTRIFNVIVTNIAGPQLPLYLLGRRLTSFAALAFLPRRHTVSFAVMSVDGALTFGLLGAPEVMGDLDDLADAVQASMAELLAASCN